MSQILIKNGYVISMNKNREIFKNGSVLIEDDKIKAVGKVEPSLVNADAEIYDVQGKIILPGLVNTHVHLSQQLGRGVADDVVLLTWLRERVWPYESSFNYEDSLISSTACCVELIKTGVTTFLEAGGQYVDAMAEAVEKCGLRACLSKKYNDTADGRIKIWFGLRTIFNNSDELIKGTKTLADKYNTGIHMHVLEVKEEMDYTRATRGETTVEHMNRLGALGPNLVAAHTVWLTEREIDLFRLYDVKVSHNPGAAMKVVLGFAKIPEMLEKGIAVSIGTDGAPSNNRMDMMRDMYLTSLIHKGRTLNPKTVSAEQVLEMATINGARCALMEKEIGSLEVGKKADLIILNPDTIHSLPVIDPVANIVYAMSSENVESNMCNGKWLMKNREILFLDEKDLLEKVKIQNKKVMDKAGIVIPDRFPVIEIK